MYVKTNRVRLSHYVCACENDKAPIILRLLAYFGEVKAVKWLHILHDNGHVFLITGCVEALQEFRDELGLING